MTPPRVLFVCVRNAGKSPMAAALLARAAGPDVEIRSAGTAAQGEVNAESVQALREIGVDLTGHVPCRLTGDDLAWADRVVVLGDRAEVGGGVPVEVWRTDEPSERGITGIERMRLVRDDIDARVHRLLTELRGG